MFILFYLFIACGYNKDELYNIVVHEKNEGYDAMESPIIIPVTDGKDSVYCCKSPLQFYADMEVFIIGETEFTLMLYKNITNNTYTLISSSLIKQYNFEGDIVIENMEMKDIYEKKGIQYLLKRYLTKYGKMPYDVLSIREINYLYYLSFMNGIYYYFSDEDGGYYVSGDFWNK